MAPKFKQILGQYRTFIILILLWLLLPLYNPYECMNEIQSNVSQTCVIWRTRYRQTFNQAVHDEYIFYNPNLDWRSALRVSVSSVYTTCMFV